MSSTPYEAVPSKGFRAISNRHKAFIAGAVVLVVAAVITLSVVLTQSDDDNNTSDDSTAVTTSNSLMLPQVAVANLTMVSATTDDDSKDRCVELEWIPTGVDWVASSGSSIWYLCMQQSVEATESEGDVGAVDLDEVSVMQRVVVVSDATSCPSNMQAIVNPASSVFVCVEFVSATEAFDTQQYVVDLMTTTESFYNHDTPGWITWPVDLKFDSDASSVFLSARYPVRPIVALEVLTNVDTNSIYSACQELGPQGEWETPGFVLKSSEGASSNSDTSDVIVCVQRPLANATGALTVLTDLNVVLPTETCPGVAETATSTEITSDLIKLCAEWGSVEFDNSSLNSTISASNQATSPFVAELSLYETADSEAADFNASATIPGAWDIIGNESTGTVHTFFLARKFEPFVLNSTTVSTGSGESNDDEVSSSVEAVASSSTEELSFKVLQIADMHLTGNPDYPCSSGPSSTIRASILAAASIIAEQLREESNSSSSASAGEENDPKYNECREALTVAFLDELLDIEQPDFVVFSGDNVQPDLDTTIHAFAMSIFTARVESRGIPWAAVFGNHDIEGGLTRDEMLELMTQGKQYSHVKYGPRDIGGVGNYEVNVVAPTDGPWGLQGVTVFRMYFLDSHASIDTATYPLVNNPTTYDWIKESQVEFYRELVQSHAEEGSSNSSSQNATDGSVPAVMYYHIPVPEYALTSPLNRMGDKNEKTASSAVNSGLFSALVEVGDVKATFVGHDHINEYCYLRQGVQLCYGGGIGLGRAYGLSDFERRARVLEWTFNTNQTRTLRSWKRHFADPTQIQSLELLYSE
ncbi:putative inactive purple acid phosphatase 29 [Phytophthora ramorum]|uniref:putative inactive purple acid phosphatase 29 n=1 Tax=Phytophthora ramorum TaxID=164328 RepID=UPI0030A853F5|nr:putative inactive purple acid phosphatase 29 [Phytophthora ramorum]